MKGTISDLGIGQLLQFPAMSAKTGRLQLSRGEERASLYYEKGELYHASLGTLEGFPVLVEILPWADGSFEFESDVVPHVRTIDMDVGKALMRATIESEEQAEAAKAEASAQATAAFHSHFGASWSGKTFARLTTFLAEHPLFFYACVMKRDGEVKAEYVKPVDDLDASAQTFSVLRGIMKNYAHVCQDRMVVDASYCTIALHAFGDDEVLIALAKSSTPEMEVEAAIDGLVLKLEDPFQL
jgi:hypothetical protein